MAGSSRDKEQAEPFEEEEPVEEEEPAEQPRELYVPGGNPIFRIGGSVGWEEPVKPVRAIIPRDVASRNNILFLRRDLHYKPPHSEPKDVSIVYGGKITVKAYICSIIDDSIISLGIDPQVSYKLAWLIQTPNTL